VSVRRSSWHRAPRAALLPLLFAGSELAWAYLWLAWFCHLAFVGLKRPALSWLLATLILGAAMVLTHATITRSGASRRAGLTILAAGLAIVLAATWLSFGQPAPRLQDLVDLPDRLGSAPDVDVALVFGAYLWWRGIAVARNPLHFDDASARLALGSAALAVGLVLSGASGSTLGGGALALLAVEFFGCALPALALARLEDIRRNRVVDSAGLGLSREWLGVLGLVVVGILLLAVALTSAVSRDAERLLSTGLNAAADALLIVVYVLLLPIGLLVWGLVIVGQFLVALITGGHVQPPAPPISTEPLNRQPSTGTTHLPAAFTATGKWVLLAIVVAAVATAIVRAVFRYQRSRGTDVEELHESIWPGDSLWAALVAWVRAFFGRFRRRAAVTESAALYPEAIARSAEAASVRALYRRWLGAAAALGRGRRPPETPAEFLAAGRTLLPAVDSELATLTRAYEAARYGDTLTEAAAAMAALAWRRIDEQVAEAAAQRSAP